ncbi:kinase-like domain-containing protein [Hysterangium stoloniferum]|nr:kinase-like domain-containing protein [Hysterangium stoloniferum]
MPAERLWAKHQIWLESCGYKLRSRYQHDWVASWKGTKKDPVDCEDSVIPAYFRIMDATRISDGAPVALKVIWTDRRSDETRIGQLFSSPGLATDPRNHCVPIYEVMEGPNIEDMRLLVMPLLRSWLNPPFVTVGEAVEFFRQIFEGLSYMHELNIAHRDLHRGNIMMDAREMYPKGYHPLRPPKSKDLRRYVTHYTRTERSPKYYLLDFGLSRHYPEIRLDIPVRGGDKSVPEFQGEGHKTPYDPFPVDVYYLGNIIFEKFLSVYSNLEFVRPLVSEMIQNDPKKRPTIFQVVSRMDEIISTFNEFQLRCRLIRRTEHMPFRLIRDVIHFMRQARFVVGRVPPMPPKRVPVPHSEDAQASIRAFNATTRPHMRVANGLVIFGERPYRHPYIPDDQIHISDEESAGEEVPEEEVAGKEAPDEKTPDEHHPPHMPTDNATDLSSA